MLPLGPYLLDFLTVIKYVIATINLLFHNMHKSFSFLDQPLTDMGEMLCSYSDWEEALSVGAEQE